MLNFDDKYFENNQSKLLYIANRWWSRWLLGLNRLPDKIKGKKIDKITPSSIHWKTGKKEYTGAFFTRPRFAEALAFNLSPFAYLMNNSMKRWQWRFSPIGVTAMFLLVLSGHGFAFLGTTTSYYADAGDGVVSRQSATWSDAQGNANGNGYNTSNETQTFGIRYSSGNYNIWRLFFPIDTGGLPDTCTISSASFYIKNSYPLDSTNVGVSTILEWTGGTDISNSDYSAFNTTKLANDININADDTYFHWDLNETGIGVINKTGWTNFCLRETGHDYNNSSSTSSIGSNIYMSNYTGTSSDPYISITYTTEVPFIPQIKII